MCAWVSLQGFPVTIMDVAEKLWALLAEAPSYERSLAVAEQLWRLRRAGGAVRGRQRSRATPPSRVSARNWLSLRKEAFKDSSLL